MTGKTTKRRSKRKPPPTRWRRFVTWLSQTHPIARAVVGLVPTIATILGLLLAFGVISPANASDRLARGVDQSMATTSTVRLAVSADIAGESVSFTASGAFDYQARRGSLLYGFTGVEGLATEVDVEGRFIDGVAFIQLPTSVRRKRAPAWVQIDTPAINELLRDIGEAGIAPAATQELTILADVSIADPTRVLKQLEDAGDVEKVGEEQLLGVPTEAFRGVLTLPGGRRLEAQAWIDEDDRIRKLELRAADSGRQISVAMEFGGYGDPVEVVKPGSWLLASELYGPRANG